MKIKRYVISTISLVLISLIIAGGVVVIVDPFFHYHKPLAGIIYRMREERYTNPGIAAHFEYDTIITGTSMSRNVMPSKVDEMFGGKSIKLPIPGAQLGDIGDIIKYAYSKHDGSIDRVIISLDIDRLINDSSARNDSALPHYLYDDSYTNDINYLFNKSVLVHDVLGDFIETAKGGEGTSLDEYGSYEGDTGQNNVFEKYNRLSDYSVCDTQKEFTEEDRDMVIDNISENYISVIKEHPETDFYFYIPPYSVLYWDDIIRDGEFERQFGAWEVVLKRLLEYDNVKIYDFYDWHDTIDDFDNYYDSIHFNLEISNRMVECMSKDEHQVALDSVDDILTRNKEWFMQYDYDSLFASEE